MNVATFLDRRRYAETPSGRIAYVEMGEGPVVLFVHGVFLNALLWRPVMEQLAGEYRCIAVDLLCHGATETPADQDVSFAANARMLEEFCAALGIERCHLAANDSGGGIAQIFAADHPERIESLVLTNCDVHDMWPPDLIKPMKKMIVEEGFAAVAEGLAKDVTAAREAFAVGFEDAGALPEEEFNAYLGPLTSSPERADLMTRFFASMNPADTVAAEAGLRQLQAPTLIAWGTADEFFSLDCAKWLENTIPGARPVIQIAGAKLFFPRERPDEFVSLLRRHWKDAAPMPSAARA
ncbi:alpha/beta fold hydrolase [Tepidicaulis sp. LMO-SS28]|uniref:alpha/beta fold hydrolase n=1 Tax=Tepidicaulis sp. LMO-SS28 TaxID=3447455 RepID=UPI003EE09DB9